MYKTALNHGHSLRGPHPPPHPEKSQDAIGFLINSGTDPIEEQLGPLQPIASQGDSLRLSLKHFDG